MGCSTRKNLIIFKPASYFLNNQKRNWGGTDVFLSDGLNINKKKNKSAFFFSFLYIHFNEGRREKKYKLIKKCV